MQNKKFSRRDFLNVSVGAAAGSVLAACGAAEPQVVEKVVTVEVEKEVVKEVEVEKIVEVTAAAPPPEGAIPIRFAAHGGWDWMIAWLGLIDAYNAEHEGEIFVTFEHTTGDVWAKYLTQMAAGTAADVIRWEGKRAPEWMSRGEQLLDLTSYYEADETIQGEDYFEVLWTDCWYQGKLVQLPYDTSPVTVWYNRRVFDEAGVPYPPSDWGNPDWTWEAYLETCQALTQGEGPNKVFGTFGSRWWVYTHPWVWSNGGEIVTYPENEVEIDMEETIEAWQFLADLPNKYGVQPTPDQAGEGASALFESGRTAMTVTSASYSLRAITVANEKPEFDWDMAPIPSKDGKPVFTRSPNSSMAVYSGTQYPQEAYNFAAFMSGEKAMEGITRAVPSRIAVATGSYLSRTENQNWNVQVDALINNLKLEPRTPYFEELDRTLDDAWHLVLDGVQTAEETAVQLKPQLETVLSGEA